MEQLPLHGQHQLLISSASNASSSSSSSFLHAANLVLLQAGENLQWMSSVALQGLLNLKLPFEPNAEVFARSLGGFLVLRWILRRPVLLKLSTVSWTCCFFVQAVQLRSLQGPLQSNRQQLMAAIQAADGVALQIVQAGRAWLDLILPFHTELHRLDVVRVFIMDHTTPRQRMWMLGLLGFGAIMIWRPWEPMLEKLRESIKAARTTGKNATKRMCELGGTALKNIALLLLAAGVWYGASFLPTPWMSYLVGHAVTTVPTILSIGALTMHTRACEDCIAAAKAHAEAKRAASSGGFFASWGRRRPQAGDAAAGAEVVTPPAPPQPKPVGRMKGGRLWLSYWACWPLFWLLQFGIAWLPVLVKGKEGRIAQRMGLQSMLLLVLWATTMRGAEYLQGTVSWLIGTDLPGYIMELVGSLTAMLGGAAANVVGYRMLQRLSFLTSFVGSRGWSMLGLGLGLGALTLALAWMFQAALETVSGLIMVALYVLASCEASTELNRPVVSSDKHNEGLEDPIRGKLAFWVMSMCWSAGADMITQIPLTGWFVRIATPFAFPAFLLAGEKLFRRLLYPLLNKAESFLRRFPMFWQQLLLQAHGLHKNHVEKPADPASWKEETNLAASAPLGSAMTQGQAAHFEETGAAEIAAGSPSLQESQQKSTASTSSAAAAAPAAATSSEVPVERVAPQRSSTQQPESSPASSLGKQANNSRKTNKRRSR